MVPTRMPTSTKHSKYVVKEKYEYFDDISFIERFGITRVFFKDKVAIPFYYEKLLD
jgi:hypothetical protein